MTARLTASAGRTWAVLDGIGRVAVAVSGGVDSMTLAVVAGRRLGAGASMLHAVSPAVPPEATARVRAYAEREGWGLEVIDAGEFADPDYLQEPGQPLLLLQDQPLRRDRGAHRGDDLLGHQSRRSRRLSPGPAGGRASMACAIPTSRPGSTRRRVRALARRPWASTISPSCRRRPACRAGSRPAST